MRLDYVQLDTITIGERFRKDLGDIDGLVNSIKVQGIIQPLCVEQLSDNSYMLLAGGRRCHAARVAGLSIVPANIYEPGEVDEYERRIIELTENVIRKDMTWQEQIDIRAEIHRLRVEKYGEVTHAPGTEGSVMGSVGSTADMLGITRQGLGQDLLLHRAMQALPELAAMPTKAEAFKRLKSMKTEVQRAEVADKFQERINTGNASRLKSDICNGYIIGDIWKGRCLEDLPEGAFDVVEFDPPYGIDYDKKKKTEEHNTGVQYADGKVKLGQYTEISQADYPVFLDYTVTQICRIMAPNSWLIMWYGIHPWHDHILKLLREKGLTTTGIPCIWNKGYGQCEAPLYNMANTYEPFFYARKGVPKLYKQGHANVFNFRPVSHNNKIHATEKPIEMYEEILSIFCWEGTRFCTPCAGSGNALLAASNLSMIGVGFDTNKTHRDAFVERVMLGEPGGYKSYV